jgi:hypothetical protein
MERVLEERYPEIQTINATAEGFPLADAAADLITVAQAFHLLDVGRAAREFHQVRKPRCALRGLRGPGEAIQQVEGLT